MLNHLRFHRAMICGLIFFAPMIPPASADPKGGEEFVNLFNGEDLTGWVNVNCAPETWSVKDGMIHCTGKPIGALRTERMFENFVLELEWRHLKEGGNAGVFIWAGPISAPGQPFLRAIEVQVLDHGYGKSDWFTTHGDVFPIHGSKMKPHGRHSGMRSFPSEERSKGAPEWNHYRIECKEGVLRLHVNGKEVSGGSECSWRKGYIALESESSPVDFRNIRIKEFPPSGGLPEEMTADAARGFEALYNGVDFRGWNPPKAEGARWEPKDWVIKAGEDTFWSEEEFGNGEVIVDWKFPKGAPEDASAEIQLRGRDGFAVEISNGSGGSGRIGTSPPGKRADRKAGSWNRMIVSVEGGVASVVVNDQLVGEGIKLPGAAEAKGAIGLRSNAEGTEFANVYLLKK